jgi:hypothetical protein
VSSETWGDEFSLSTPKERTFHFVQSSSSLSVGDKGYRDVTRMMTTESGTHSISDRGGPWGNRAERWHKEGQAGVLQPPQESEQSGANTEGTRAATGRSRGGAGQGHLEVHLIENAEGITWHMSVLRAHRRRK